ncbi:hypothetical protein [Streptomyces sp. NPDC058964]|uniref:hypothetical protein n=1 Tax=Streptomyces sp. NPDC058964 TaxID=3346681 RepID=UPI0036CFA260
MQTAQVEAASSPRTNWAAGAAFVLAVVAALCVLASRMLASHANAVDDESAGVMSLLTLAASFTGALPAVVLGIRGIATRRGTRGLGLAIAAVVGAGGWLLFGVVVWLGLAAGII